MDAQEQAFLADVWEVLRAGHYKLLGKQEWESALAEDFMVGVGTLSFLFSPIRLWGGISKQAGVGERAGGEIHGGWRRG